MLILFDCGKEFHCQWHWCVCVFSPYPSPSIWALVWYYIYGNTFEQSWRSTLVNGWKLLKDYMSGGKGCHAYYITNPPTHFIRKWSLLFNFSRLLLGILEQTYFLCKLDNQQLWNPLIARWGEWYDKGGIIYSSIYIMISYKKIPSEMEVALLP